MDKFEGRNHVNTTPNEEEKTARSPGHCTVSQVDRNCMSFISCCFRICRILQIWPTAPINYSKTTPNKEMCPIKR